MEKQKNLSISKVKTKNSYFYRQNSISLKAKQQAIKITESTRKLNFIWYISFLWRLKKVFHTFQKHKTKHLNWLKQENIWLTTEGNPQLFTWQIPKDILYLIFISNNISNEAGFKVNHMLLPKLSIW